MGTHRMGTADTKHLTTACLGAPCPSDSRPSPLRILQCFQTPRLSFLYNCSALQGVWYLGTSLMPGQTRNTWAHPQYLGTTPLPGHTPGTQAHPQCLGTSPMPGHIPDNSKVRAHPSLPSLQPHRRPHVPQQVLLLSVLTGAPNPPPHGAPTLARVTPRDPAQAMGHGMLHPAPARARTPAFARTAEPTGTHFLRGLRVRVPVMHTRHSPAANTEAQPRCHGTLCPGPAVASPTSTPLHPQNGARMSHLPPQPHRSDALGTGDPLPSLPLLTLAWEDEDEEGADASNELNDLANVRDEQGDGECGGHPGDCQCHPVPPLVRLGYRRGPALGR